jgi:hypothetical protein
MLMIANQEGSSFSKIHLSEACSACEGSVKSLKREFSLQAWTALVRWGEISSQSVEQPICGDCYANFREVLIDRADELRVC